jgi:beta-barrel assembly-enhancing protease
MSASFQTEFRAMAYADDVVNGSAVGSVSFSQGMLHFRSEKASRSVSLSETQLRLDGDGGKQPFFSHPALPGWQILLLETGALHSPELLAHPHLAAVAQRGAKLQKKLAPGLKFLLWLPVILLVLLAGSFMALKPLANAAAKKVPVSVEVDFGNLIWKSMRSQEIPLKDLEPEQQAKVEKAWERLLPHIKTSGYPFQLHVLRDATPNAFAIPGGHMALHTGLLEMAKTPEQVAGVIAHEISHVTQRHSLRNMMQSAGLSMVFGVLLGSPDLASLAGMAEELQALSYSRDMEREADDVGWNYLLKAEINPRGMVEFFELLAKEEGVSGNMPALLSTHPATAERIANLQERLQNLSSDFKAKPL